MSLAARTFTFPSVAAALAVVVAVMGLGAGRAHAQSPQSPAASDADRAGLSAERARVRAQLDRVNAEIDALKRASGRSPLGIRDDYRLRERLADAEALARRLTEIDARLGTPARPAAGEPGAALAVAPAPSASDGPAELEAKADILADQARRVAGEADVLSRRAGQLRARQDLRRRAGQIERDPFSPLEGSKRRAISTQSPTAPPATAFGPGSVQINGSTTGSGSTVDHGASGGSSTPVLGPTSSVSTPPRALVAPTAAPSPTTGAASDAGSLAAQLHDLLDPATLAEIRRLETSGMPGAGVEALERAALALRARADRMKAQSEALRLRARSHGQ